jgi:hypothetical protein
MTKAPFAALVVLVASLTGTRAASPPTTLNYQGVLRDATDKPSSGSFDMLFAFYDAAAAGNQIMTDQHAAATGNAVVVSGGLFTAALGGGTVADGSGPGAYTDLGSVFRDYANVWMEIQVGGETLSPRVPIRSAGYALNAANLNGQPSTSFLDTTSTTQTKNGSLLLQNSLGDRVTLADGSAGLGIFAFGRYRGASIQNGYGEYVTLGDVNSGVYTEVGTNALAGNFNSTNCQVILGDEDTYNNQSTGVRAVAGTIGGSFYDGGGDYSFVGYNGFGIQSYGTTTGGFFRDVSTSAYGYVGYGAYKIWGNGAVSFVQNHPADRDKVIVYAAPEGDEVAVYTRGSARLIGGVARVPLGETFAWVANPDIGLTAHVTPIGGWADLYVESKSTKEIVVRAADPRAADVAFDYVVYGLRIGFEQMTIVQPKRDESKIPSMAGPHAQVEQQPELARYTALERFKAMSAGTTPSAALDMTASRKLHDAIGEFVADHDGPAKPARIASAKAGAAPSSTSPAMPPDAPRASPPPIDAPAAVPTAASGSAVPARSTALPALASLVAVGEAVSPGDVLANDELHPAVMKAADRAEDPGVIGIVAGDSGDSWHDEAPVALAGSVVLCRVDAANGAIRLNDLLVSSSLRGHAMRAAEPPKPGTVIGKALEPLESGTGLIRVLVMSR